MSAIEEQIRQIKTEAARLQQQGDTPAALAKLKEARTLEFSQIKSLDEISDPQKLKQLALYYKQLGDVENAKRALLKSKQMMIQGSVADAAAPPATVPPSKPSPPVELEVPKPVEPAPPIVEASPPEAEPVPDVVPDNELPPPPQLPPPPAYVESELPPPPAYCELSLPPPMMPETVPGSSLDENENAGGGEEPNAEEVEAMKKLQQELYGGATTAALPPPEMKSSDTDIGGNDQEVEAMKKLQQELDGGAPTGAPSKPKPETPPKPDDGRNAESDDTGDEEPNAEDVEAMKKLQKELYGGAGSDDDGSDVDVDDADVDLADLDLDDGEDDFDPSAVCFSEEEMLDLEMMTEFKVGGLGVPSQEDYEAKIAECKQNAINFKNAGDKANAIVHLKNMKQYQVVMEGLSQVEGGLNLKGNDDDDQWLEELNQDDHELMRDLFSDPSCNPTKSSFDISDLEALDEDGLRDAVELGMEIPSPQEVLEQAESKKKLAIQLKRGGDLKGAQTALTEFKALKRQAERLEALLASSGSDAKPLSDDDLEGLMSSESAAPAKPEVKQEDKSKTAEELKAEAVKLRDENKIKEATEVLKLYKLAVQRENQAAEKERRAEIVREIGEEIIKAKEQAKIFAYYKRFVDEQIGSEQINGWLTYATQCTKAANNITAKGSTSVSIERKVGQLSVLEWENLPAVIQNATDPSQTQLEVTVIGVGDIEKSKAGKKLSDAKPSTLRVSISIQLPVSDDDDVCSINLDFDSNPTSEEDPLKFVFDLSKSKFVDLARGDSKLAKNIVRRMDRRKIQVQLNHHEIQAPRSKGLFGRSSKTPPPEPTYIGRIMLELKGLLTGNCIVGEFPLAAASGKPSGGYVGLCIRTGVAFDPDQLLSHEQCELVPHPYKAMSFIANETSTP